MVRIVEGSVLQNVYACGNDWAFFYQLFKGTFYYCKGPNVQHVINKSQCQADKQNVWTNHKYNFDNLGMVSKIS